MAPSSKAAQVLCLLSQSVKIASHCAVVTVFRFGHPVNVLFHTGTGEEK